MRALKGENTLTKEKALNLLGLSEDYTERDLKKSYHQLTKIYHPDKLGDNVAKKKDCEEKMKEINAAKDLLEHLLKSKNNNSNHNNDNIGKDNDDITKLKKKLIEKLEELEKLEKLQNNQKCECLTNCKYDIQIIIFEFKNKISKSHNKNNILSSYEQAFNEIIDKFIELKDDFFKKNGIIENETIKNEIKQVISRKVNLGDFFEILLTIKSKYGKKEIFKAKIKDDLSEYQNRNGYEILKNNIEQIIEDNYKFFKYNNHDNYNACLNKIKKSINNLFLTYFNLLSDIDQLLCLFDSSEMGNDDTNEYKEQLNCIKKELIDNDSIIDFNKIKDDINRLKDYIKVKRNSAIIDKINKSIFANFNKTISNLNQKKDYDKINLARKTFNKVMSLLEDVNNGIIPIESYVQLNNLTFLDYDKDKELLNKIDGHDNSRGIYVLKSYYNNFNDIILCKIVEETNNEVVFQGLTFLEIKREERVSQEQFDQMYVPLERILKDCKVYKKDDTVSSIIVCITDFIIFKLNIGLDVVRFEPNMELNKQNTNNDNHKYFQDKCYLNDIINKIDLLLTKQKQKTIKL